MGGMSECRSCGSGGTQWTMNKFQVWFHSDHPPFTDTERVKAISQVLHSTTKVCIAPLTASL